MGSGGGGGQQRRDEVKIVNRIAEQRRPRPAISGAGDDGGQQQGVGDAGRIVARSGVSSSAEATAATAKA